MVTYEEDYPGLQTTNLINLGYAFEDAQIVKKLLKTLF